MVQLLAQNELTSSVPSIACRVTHNHCIICSNAFDIWSDILKKYGFMYTVFSHLENTDPTNFDSAITSSGIEWVELLSTSSSSFFYPFSFNHFILPDKNGFSGSFKKKQQNLHSLPMPHNFSRFFSYRFIHFFNEPLRS